MPVEMTLGPSMCKLAADINSELYTGWPQKVSHYQVIKK